MATAVPEALEIEESRNNTDEKPSSFLNPSGNAPEVAPPKEKAIGRVGELMLFAFFVCTRAIHPSVIHDSKTLLPNGEMGFAYSGLSTVIVFQVVVLAFAQLYILGTGGLKQWKSIWVNKKALLIFGFNGTLYALGDWLEMESLGKMGGSLYQILLQSKFLVTAVMMMYVKGTRQTRLQWTLLIILMLSASLYMCISKGTGGSAPLIGMLFVLLKVLVGCYGAVMTDRYTKEFKDLPVHIVLVQMSVPRLVATLLLSFMNLDDWQRGIFHGWDAMTCGVTASFIVKSVTSLYIVSLLDSLLKNIGETLAVLLIYAWEVVPVVLDPQGSLNLQQLIAVVVIILTVSAYLDTKKVTEKAKQLDDLRKKEQSAQDTRWVAA